MGGQSGARGYIFQALVAALDSMNDKEWTALTIEPSDHSLEKVDIQWVYPAYSRVVQVKHSKNPISRSHATKWASELKSSVVENARYELALLGATTPNLKSQNEIVGVKIRLLGSAELPALIERAAQKIGHYLEEHHIKGVTAKSRELIVHGLTNKLGTLSTEGKTLNRSDFEALMLGWIISVMGEIQDDYEGQLRRLQENLRATARYEILRQACMDALDTFDEYVWLMICEVEPRFSRKKSPKNAAEISAMARNIYNRLVVACDDTELLGRFRNAFRFGAESNPNFGSALVELRSAARKALGFSDEAIDINKKAAWLTLVHPKAYDFSDAGNMYDEIFDDQEVGNKHKTHKKE